MKRINIEVEMYEKLDYRKWLLSILDIAKFICKFQYKMLLDYTVTYVSDCVLYINVKEYTDPELDQI